jgi:hypothetical protein
MATVLEIIEDSEGNADITMDFSQEEWDSLLAYGKANFTCESDEDYIKEAFLEALNNATSNDY